MLNGHGGNINQICSKYGLDPDEIIDFSRKNYAAPVEDVKRKITEEENKLLGRERG